MKLLALLALMAPLGAYAASSASCDGLKQNILTSATGVCPPECGSYPCVLYSPSQNSTCEGSQLAGECQKYDSFVDPISQAECNVTYQCLEGILDSSTKKWFLALTKSSLTESKVTTAAVTQIQELKYPTNTTTIQLAGGLGRNVRGDVKNVIFDESFFATPSSAVSFYLSDINLPTFLSKINFASVKWVNIAWNNANLDAVPAGLSSLALQYVELSKNFIKVVNDSKPFAKVTTLKLDQNDLTDLNIELPAVVTLNLSGNPLTKIPDSVFRMTNLQTLSMRNCNLTNLQLTEAQLAFLSQRQTFDASPIALNCSSGYIPKNFTTIVGSVCVPGVAETAVVEKSGGSSSTGIIIGVVAGVVVIAILAFFLFRRRRSRNYDDSYHGHVDKLTTYTNDTEFTVGSGGTDSSIWNDPDLLAVRVEHRDIEPIKLLSRGGFGEVWLGLYMNENVAIKRLLNDKKNMSDAMAFASEIKIMARLEHPKIVRFIGVSWTNALTIQAVTEFMDCGDLRSLLDSSRASSLTWANLKCQIAIDVADALVYLHTLNPKLIHRDLKSRNVLIDANTGAKLSDFGISRNRSVEETMTAGVGTARWIAPEVILGGHYTEFADIYSFGVVLSELDTNKTPFHDATNTNGAKMQDVTILQLVSAGKLQPSFTTSCPEPIVKLARACMSFDPEQRPSAIHISYELRKILKDEL